MQNVIVFDFDGVLADTMKDMLQFSKIVCEAMGYPCEPSPNDLNALERMSFSELGKQLGIPANNVAEFVDLTFQLFAVQPLPPRIFPGMKDVVLRLASDYKIAILTGNTSAVVNRFLDHHGLSSSIDKVFGEDIPGDRAVKLAQLVSILGGPGGKSYMVGDAVSDIRVARAASVTSIAVTWGHQSEQKLLADKPCFLVHTPQELLQVLSASLTKAQA